MAGISKLDIYMMIRMMRRGGRSMNSMTHSVRIYSSHILMFDRCNSTMLDLSNEEWWKISCGRFSQNTIK